MIKTVESLESHGAEYIDTGIAVIPGRKIVVDFEFTQIINDTWVAGASNNPIRIGYFAGTFNNQLYTGASARYSPNELGIGIRVIATMEVSYDISRTLYLFGRNWDNVANGFAYCKIYSAKIYEGSNIIADFVPFVNTETDVCGMYDRVSDTFFYNQGGGNFTAHVGWEITNGQITNGNFIPMPELYDTQPDVLWRIEDNNLFNKLAPQTTNFGAFAHATRLQGISIPKSCKYLGEESFTESGLTSVTIASDCEYSTNTFPPQCVVNFYTN